MSLPIWSLLILIAGGTVLAGLLISCVNGLNSLCERVMLLEQRIDTVLEEAVKHSHDETDSRNSPGMW